MSYIQQRSCKFYIKKKSYLNAKVIIDNALATQCNVKIRIDFSIFSKIQTPGGCYNVILYNLYPNKLV